MTFTQSPSVSNNPKIPTYYLIFAVPQYYVEFIFIAVSCFHIWSLNTPLSSKGHTGYLSQNSMCGHWGRSAVQCRMFWGAGRPWLSSPPPPPVLTTLQPAIFFSLFNLQWNLQVHCKSVGDCYAPHQKVQKRAVHKVHMHTYSATLLIVNVCNMKSVRVQCSWLVTTTHYLRWTKEMLYSAVRH